MSEVLMLRHPAGHLFFTEGFEHSAGLQACSVKSAHNIRGDCCIRPCCQHTHEHAEKVKLKPLAPCRAWWRRW